jgi:RNA polymerase sigma-70 factor (ECF subfamily)
MGLLRNCCQLYGAGSAPDQRALRRRCPIRQPRQKIIVINTARAQTGTDPLPAMGRTQAMKTEPAMHKDPEDTDQTRRWNTCLETVARTGDKALYLQFYDHFAPRLQSWLTGMTRDSNLAEELVQEAMITVWRKAAQYDASKAAASTWLYRIARNLYVDQLRREKVRNRAVILLEDPPEVDEPEGDAERVRKAIDTLPFQQAQVIYKAYFEGKSHQEIANDMDLPLGSVKSSLRLAFQKLCHIMRPPQ